MTEIASSSSRPRRLGLKIGLGVVSVALMMVLLFLLAGRWDWFEGWAFIGIGTLSQAISTLYVRFKNPGLLSKRGEVGKGTKAWDKVRRALVESGPRRTSEGCRQ